MSEKCLNVGIAGLGTVGAGVAKILLGQEDIIASRAGKKIKIVAVSARSKKDRGVNLDGARWYDNAVEMAADPNVDVVVELIGGATGVAYDVCEAALKNGKHFVTANKALIARHGTHVATLAEKNNVHIAFEAAVAGGIPIIKTLKESLAGNQIKGLSGILNGTCNYILTTMQRTGRDFNDILKEAQDLGYAEADPGFDIDGVDAAHKLAILTAIAFGTEVDFAAVHTDGIRNVSLLDMNYANELGYTIKLLGLCSISENGISQRVCPCLVSKKYPVSGVDGVNNAVFIEANAVGQLVLVGPGAGQGPTASAVVADIIDMAAGRFAPAFNVPVAKLKKANFVKISEHQGEYYLRVSALDKAGALAGVVDILRDEGISVESVLQKPAAAGEHAQIIVITHVTSEQSMTKAVEKIEKVDSVVSKPNVIRIES